ncbi:MAG: hypothetical protein VCC00_02195 [Deltaproteobacteria bacterium]
MRKLFYGIVIGAAGMYFYLVHGHQVDTALDTLLSWRNGAKQSVYGYGGSR